MEIVYDKLEGLADYEIYVEEKNYRYEFDSEIEDYKLSLDQLKDKYYNEALRDAAYKKIAEYTDDYINILNRRCSEGNIYEL